MECIHCKVEIESDDNFCHNCGEMTAHGYSFIKNEENIKMIMNGSAIKQDTKFSLLMSLLGIGTLLFVAMMFIRGDDLFKPFIYLKKEMTNYIYGYNTSIIKTDNKYSNENIDSYASALSLIKKDFDDQSYLCEKNVDVSIIENELEKNFSIPSVNFCDASYDNVLKIKNVINKMYDLFPNIKGALTNITVTNANSASEYIAYFQPLYQFANINENINSFNKVNKTQILLNSYYFLNDELLEKNIESVVLENWYVDDATWESTIAHELGHYISFVVLLKENGLSNITFETKENQTKIKKVIEIFNSGTHSNQLVNFALVSFNSKYNLNYDVNTFAETISKYAAAKDKSGNVIADEIIAEALHDYYLHGNEMNKSSAEIVNVIKSRL